MKVKSESEVAQLCLTLSNPMNCSLPGSSVHGFSRQEYWSAVPLPSLNVLSRLIKSFIPRSKCLLISWLQPPSEVILEPKKRNSVTTSTFLFLFAVKAGTGCHDLSFLNVEL